jgi:hypothetical protein
MLFVIASNSVDGLAAGGSCRKYGACDHVGHLPFSGMRGVESNLSVGVSAFFARSECLLSTYSIEHDFPRRIDLLQQVKVPKVAGQHRTSVFSSGGE